MTSAPLIRTQNIDGLEADLGSDWHLLAQGKQSGIDVVARAIDLLRAQQRAEVLFLLGDLFDAAEGQDRSPEINEVLNEAARRYGRVVYTPGNHCLRGRDNPWGSFDVASNVILPRDIDPLTETIGNKRMLIGNLFYDFGFIDPSLVGISSDDISMQYQNSNDGKYLFNGRTDNFKDFTEAFAAKINPSIDVIVTHVLPTPALVTFKFGAVTEEMQRLATRKGLTFTCNPEEDQAMADKYFTTPEFIRNYWNIKSFFMGSNVISHPAANPRDGLVSLYGHNHRQEANPTKIIDGQTMHFYSYQPNKVDV